MKKILVILLISILILNNIHPKIGIISLNKTKEKIENAINNAITLTKENIKDFLNPKENKKDIKTTDDKKLKEKDNQNPEYYVELEKTGNNILKNKNLWSQQEDFIKNLKNTFNRSREDSNLLLANKIKEKYNNSNTPVIDFIYSLKIEEESLKDLNEKLEKINEKKNFINDDKLYLKLINLVNPLSKLKTNLEDLVAITNKLLTY